MKIGFYNNNIKQDSQNNNLAVKNPLNSNNNFHDILIKNENIAFNGGSTEDYFEYVQKKISSNSGIDINYQNKYGDTGLTQAAVTGNVELAKTLLEKGINPDQKNNLGRTALMHAAECGHKEVVELLIKNNASVNIQDRNGKTALKSAVAGGHFNIVKILLDNGADPNIQNRFGNTAMMTAAYNGRNDMLLELFKNGADPNLKNEDGHTALMRAAGWLGRSYTVEVLLENGADPLLKDHTGKTALDHATGDNNEKCVEILKDYSEEKRKLNSLTTTIKQIVNKNPNDFDISKIKELMSEPEAKDAVNLRFKEQDNSTLLHLLVGRTCKSEKEETDQYDLISYLLKLGADINAKNQNDTTPIEIAESRDDELQIINLLVQGALPDNININLNDKEKKYYFALILAAKSGNTDSVKNMLEYGFNVNEQDPDGQTALMLAGYKGYLDTVELLLKNEADPNIKNVIKCTAMIYAALSGQTNVIGQLLKNKADPNIQDDKGNTALIYAVNKNHFDTVKLLLEKGADPDIKGEDGRTALADAANYDKYEMVRILTDHRADPYIRDDNGKTPLELAMRKQNYGSVQILKEYMENNKAKTGLIEKINSIIEKDPYEFSIDIIQLLTKPEIKELSKIRFKDQNSTLLHLLAGRKIENEKERNKQLNLILMLVKLDADINAKNEIGNTPLTIASMRGDEMLVKFLLENNADLNIMNSYNFKPIDYARKFKHKAVENLLNSKRQEQ